MLKIEKFDFLISVYIFCIAATELMGGKTFSILSIGAFQLNASVAIFLVPFVFTINDIITEVHGPEKARSVIRSGLIVIFLILLFSVLVTSLPPSARFKSSEKAYDLIFGLSIRISIASLISFAIAEFIDVLVFAKIRESLGRKALWFRNNVSNFISQFSDTAIFMFLAFYSFDKGFNENFPFLIGLIIPYWLLKCFMSVIETPLVYLGVGWLKKDKK